MFDNRSTKGKRREERVERNWILMLMLDPGARPHLWLFGDISQCILFLVLFLFLFFGEAPTVSVRGENQASKFLASAWKAGCISFFQSSADPERGVGGGWAWVCRVDLSSP